MNTAPQVFEVTTTDVTEIIDSDRSSQRSSNIKGVAISIHDSETGRVHLSFGSRKVTADTGLTIYPGQGLILESTDPRTKSIATSGLFAIASVATTNLRVQFIS